AAATCRTTRASGAWQAKQYKHMVNRNLIGGLDSNNKDEWEDELALAMGGTATEEIDWGGGELAVNKIIDGKILRIDNEFVLVDVGYKSEGIIPLNEWEEGEEPPRVGEHVKVLIEDVEDVFGRTEESRGMIALSKRKAEKIEAWLKVMETVHE